MMREEGGLVIHSYPFAYYSRKKPFSHRVFNNKHQLDTECITINLWIRYPEAKRHHFM